MTELEVDIEFTVQSTPYLLTVCDMSQWAFIINEPAIVEITPPGYSGKITKYFDKGKNNVFNSTILDMTCADDSGNSNKAPLSDGIYHIKVIGSPETFNKEYYYLKTDLFDMELGAIFIDKHKKKRLEDFKNGLTDIEVLLTGAKYYTKYDDVTTAGALFETAQSMLEDFKDCNGCTK